MIDLDIQANLRRIRSEIEKVCSDCNRDPQAVRLVAVSKVKPPAMIETAYAAGQTCFGESYVQEFLEKSEKVRVPVEWHFIGHLQSNKVKYLSGKVALIHSVDRLSLAKEIDRKWARLGKKANILVQVNLGDEATKSGVSEPDLEPLVREVSRLEHLQVCGLMTLPPWFENTEDVRPYFRRLRELSKQLEKRALPGVVMQELSMGMSHDFAVAIEEGATLVRIGTAIFGERLR